MTAKKPVETQETQETQEQAPEEAAPEATPEEQPRQAEEEPSGQKVCAVCGAPATMVSSSDAYSPAYYCADHGKDEPLKSYEGG